MEDWRAENLKSPGHFVRHDENGRGRSQKRERALVRRLEQRRVTAGTVAGLLFRSRGAQRDEKLPCGKAIQNSFQSALLECR